MSNPFLQPVTSTSTTSIPQQVAANYNTAVTNAATAAGTPFQSYSSDPNAFVAGLNNTQQAGIANTNAAAGQAQPYYQAATGALATGMGQAQPFIYGAANTLGQAQGIGAGLNQAAAYGYAGAPGAADPYNQAAGASYSAGLAAGMPMNAMSAQNVGQAQQQGSMANMAAMGQYGQAQQAVSPYNQAAGASYSAGLAAGMPMNAMSAQNVGQAQQQGSMANMAAMGQYGQAQQAVSPYNQAAGASYSAGLAAGMPMNAMSAQNVGQAQQQGSMANMAAMGQYGQAQQAVSPYNQAAGSAYSAGIEAANPYTYGGGQAVNAQQIGGQQIGQFMSPFLGSAYNSMLAGENMQNAQQASGLQGNSIQAGAFGGDRAGIAQANLAYQQNLANSQTNANFLNTGYNQALTAAQQQQGVNLSAQQANRAALQTTGQNLYNQYTGTGQALSNLGQNIFGQGTAVAQGVGALGQQQYAQGMGAAAQQAALGNQAYNQYTGTGQALSNLGQNVFGQGTTVAQGIGNLGQQQYAQGMGAAAQQAALGNQAYNQYTGTGQALSNLGQNVFGQGTTVAQGVGALGQQQYAQGMGAAAQQAALGNQAYNQYTGTGQALAGLGQNVYGQQTGAAQGLAGVGNQAFTQGATTAAQQAALGNQLYGMGTGASQQLAALGTGAQGAALQGAQAQMGAGQVAQQTQQAGLTALYNQFLQQQAYPFQTSQFYTNAVGSLGPLYGATTTTTQPMSIFGNARGGSVRSKYASGGLIPSSMGGAVGEEHAGEGFAYGGTPDVMSAIQAIYNPTGTASYGLAPSSAAWGDIFNTLGSQTVAKPSASQMLSDYSLLNPAALRAPPATSSSGTTTSSAPTTTSSIPYMSATSTGLGAGELGGMGGPNTGTGASVGTGSFMGDVKGLGAALDNIATGGSGWGPGVSANDGAVMEAAMESAHDSVSPSQSDSGNPNVGSSGGVYANGGRIHRAYGGTASQEESEPRNGGAGPDERNSGGRVGKYYGGAASGLGLSLQQISDIQAMMQANNGLLPGMPAGYQPMTSMNAQPGHGLAGINMQAHPSQIMRGPFIQQPNNTSVVGGLTHGVNDLKALQNDYNFFAGDNSNTQSSNTQSNSSNPGLLSTIGSALGFASGGLAGRGHYANAGSVYTSAGQEAAIPDYNSDIDFNIPDVPFNPPQIQQPQQSSGSKGGSGGGLGDLLKLAGLIGSVFKDGGSVDGRKGYALIGSVGTNDATTDNSDTYQPDPENQSIFGRWLNPQKSATGLSPSAVNEIVSDLSAKTPEQAPYSNDLSPGNQTQPITGDTLNDRVDVMRGNYDARMQAAIQAAQSIAGGPNADNARPSVPAPFVPTDTNTDTNTDQRLKDIISRGNANADASTPEAVKKTITEAAAKRGIPINLALAMFNQESSFDPNLTGGAEEIGLGQIRPSTARNPGYGMTGVDPATLVGSENIDNNVNFALDYLKAKGLAGGASNLNDPTQRRTALAAYNGGGDPNYVQHVMSRMNDGNGNVVGGSDGGGGGETSGLGRGSISTDQSQSAGLIPPNGSPYQQMQAQPLNWFQRNQDVLGGVAGAIGGMRGARNPIAAILGAVGGGASGFNAGQKALADQATSEAARNLAESQAGSQRQTVAKSQQDMLKQQQEITQKAFFQTPNLIPMVMLRNGAIINQAEWYQRGRPPVFGEPAGAIVSSVVDPSAAPPVASSAAPVAPPAALVAPPAAPPVASSVTPPAGTTPRISTTAETPQTYTYTPVIGNGGKAQIAQEVSTYQASGMPPPEPLKAYQDTLAANSAQAIKQKQQLLELAGTLVRPEGFLSTGSLAPTTQNLAAVANSILDIVGIKHEALSESVNSAQLGEKISKALVAAKASGMNERAVSALSNLSEGMANSTLNSGTVKSIIADLLVSNQRDIDINAYAKNYRAIGSRETGMQLGAPAFVESAFNTDHGLAQQQQDKLYLMHLMTPQPGLGGISPLNYIIQSPETSKYPDKGQYFSSPKNIEINHPGTYRYFSTAVQ